MDERQLMALADTLGRLDALFRPRSVAIVGASTDPRKLGGRPLDYLKRHGFAGAIYPVNPRAERVQDVAAYPSVAAIDAEVDLAIVALPAAAVRQAVEDCAQHGVKAAVLFSSGFAEVGEAGRHEQLRLAEIAKPAGMRLLGPNCLGLFSIREKLGASFSVSLSKAWPPAGGVSIVGQSGAFGSHVYVMARARGLGLSYWCATGNEVDVDVADCIAFCARDPATTVILSYMEGAGDGDRLRAALELARRERKPVVIMKVGVSAVGAEAARSHTAALAGADRVYDGAFSQHGVHRADSIDEMLDVAYACAAGKFPRGRRLGAVTISGGAGILIADKAAAVGLAMPAMPAAAQRELKSLVSFASPRNPIDVTAQALTDITLLRRNIELAAAEGGYDALVIFLAMVGMFGPMMGDVHAILDDLRRDRPDLPVVLSMVVPEEDKQRVEAGGFISFEEPSRAVAAVAALARFWENFARPPSAAAAAAEPLDPPARPTELDALRLLGAAGIATQPARLAASADAAVAAAEALGLPAAMKICSADIAHKSDIGGVRLGLASLDAVHTTYNEIVAVAGGAEIAGVLVQPMAAPGVECAVGVQRDPVFGPVVMFGLGGVFVEALQDVTFRVAPFDKDEAHRMIDGIRGRRVLDGVRGAPPADLDHLAAMLARLSSIAAASAASVESIDINPYILGPRGQGGVAVDALIVPTNAS